MALNFGDFEGDERMQKKGFYYIFVKKKRSLLFERPFTNEKVIKISRQVYIIKLQQCASRIQSYRKAFFCVLSAFFTSKLHQNDSCDDKIIILSSFKTANNNRKLCNLNENRRLGTTGNIGKVF